jgi:hypothetical protein
MILDYQTLMRPVLGPVVDGEAGHRALELADRVMAGILDHARRVQLAAFSPQEVR